MHHGDGDGDGGLWSLDDAPASICRGPTKYVMREIQGTTCRWTNGDDALSLETMVTFPDDTTAYYFQLSSYTTSITIPSWQVTFNGVRKDDDQQPIISVA